MNHERATQPGFPATRLRRLRQHPRLREMVRAIRLDPRRLIQPLFVRPGRGVRQEIAAMPGVCQLSVDELLRKAQGVAEAGVAGVILFGIPAEKDPLGQDAYSDSGIVQQAVRALKQSIPDLLVLTDVCFCEYTDHGHCGVAERVGRAARRGQRRHAGATGEAVRQPCPGRRRRGRAQRHDGRHGRRDPSRPRRGRFRHLPIMSYAAKYASALLRPVPRRGRDAAGSSAIVAATRWIRRPTPDRRCAKSSSTWPRGPTSSWSSRRWPTSIFCAASRDRFPGVPLAAYNVSGEYSMVKAAAARGWIDERSAVIESLTAMHRAGADIILTYWAKQIAGWLT